VFNMKRDLWTPCQNSCEPSYSVTWSLVRDIIITACTRGVSHCFSNEKVREIKVFMTGFNTSLISEGW
jgi:hypothetical protein